MGKIQNEEFSVQNVLFSRDGTKRYREGDTMSPVWIVYLIAQIAEQTDKVRVLQAEGDKVWVFTDFWNLSLKKYLR